MTSEEVSLRYMVPKKILTEYEAWGLCSGGKNAAGEWQYKEPDLKRLSLMMTLYNLEFSPEETKRYMKLALEGEGTREQRMRMLEHKRSSILDKIHANETQISHLDYLRYEMSGTAGTRQKI